MMEAVFIPLGSAALPVFPTPPAGERTRLVNQPRHERSQTNDDDSLARTLRGYLTAILPDYMIPAAFVVLESFPLTPNGKIDRKALPAPVAAAALPRAAAIAPRNTIEEQLVGVWREVLGRDGISTDDDVFELGADSILIFQMCTRANRLGLAITPAMVFRLRTISALAAAVPAARTTTRPAIQRANRDAYRRQI
jgi:acyl carrier protein